MTIAPILLVLYACGQPTPSDTPKAPSIELIGLGASSLTDVLPKVADAWKVHGGGTIVFSFDSSSKLVKQVEAGAPADFVFFADGDTLDVLDRKALLAARARRDVLGNSLVLVVPGTGAWTPTSAADLGSPLLVHLALAGENVPAGRYARTALQSAGVWADVEPKVVEGENVRTTLAWVTRGEAEAGVVYATDALAEPKVRTAFTFAEASHPPIVYPAAVVRASSHAKEATAFLDFCASPDGMTIFSAAGFTPPPPP